MACESGDEGGDRSLALESRFCQQPSQRVLAACSVLAAGDIAIAIDQYVNRKSVGGEHGGEVRVFHEHHLAGAWRICQILLDLFLRLTDVDAQNDQSFLTELLIEALNGRLIAPAVGAPGSRIALKLLCL